MKRVTSFLLLFLVSSSPLFAQNQDVFRDLLDKAAALMSQGKHKEAGVLYRQAHTVDSHAVAPLIGLAKIAVDQKRWEEAQDWYRQVLEIDPDNLTANNYFDNNQELASLIGQGQQLRETGNLDKATGKFNAALEIDSHSLSALKGLGKIAVAKQDWRRSRFYYGQIRAIAPDDPDAANYLNNPLIKTNLSKADSLLAKRKLKDAKELYQTVLYMDRQNVSALNGLGRLYRQMKDWGKSKKWFKKALDIDPKNEETNYYLLNGPNPKVLPVLEEAKKLQRTGEYRKAKKKYQQALKIYPGTVQAFRGLGQIAFERRNWGGIKKSYKKLLEVQPLDLEAKYRLGVAYRETGKINSLLIKRKHFNNSEHYFEEILASDSTYLDVLYQRALLARWRGNWDRALTLAHRQLMLSPTTGNATAGLVKLYRSFRLDKSKEEFDKWAANSSGVWVDYAKAEAARNAKRYAFADSIYQDLLLDPGTLGREAVYLALARSKIMQDDEEGIGQYFRVALNNISTDGDADLFFEDCKYIFTDREYDFYRTLNSAGQKKAFFKIFWTARNPTPASPLNIRAIEHYRRLAYSEANYWYDKPRSAANNPDHAGALKFPETYRLNEEFNDKGLIFIRHGEPNEVAVTHNENVNNESWYYYGRDDRPKMIFHFLIEQLTSGNNWRLVPFLSDLNMIADRLGWDATMDEIYLNQFNDKAPFAGGSGFGLKQNVAFNRLSDRSRHEVLYAMSSDFHTWDEKYEDLPVQYFVSSFRGLDNKTAVELYFGVPIAKLLPKKDSESAEMLFEHGAGLFEKSWRPVSRSHEEVYLLPTDSSRVHDGYFIGTYEFLTVPGSEKLTFYAKDLKNNRIGLRNFDLDVPAYTSGQFGISDLMLAYDIGPAREGAQFRRGKLSYIPNPSRKFRLSEPIFLYYEVYDLGRNDRGTSAYEIEIKMTQLKKNKKGLRRLLSGGGKRKKSISIKDTRQAQSQDAVEFTSFDVSRLEPGKYELSVKVKDSASGRSVDKSVEVELSGE